MVMCILVPIFSSTRYHLPTLPFRFNDPQTQTIRKSTTYVDVADAHVTTETHMDPSNDMGGAGAAAREESRAVRTLDSNGYRKPSHRMRYICYFLPQ